MLNQISENTDNIMEAMNDIVWSINTKNDKLENVINRMRAFAIELLEPHNCKINFIVDDKLNEIKLDAVQRNIFYLLYKEAINNVSKHAACKNILIELLKLKSNLLLLKIKDDGKGFDLAPNLLHDKEYSFGGNGIGNIYKRAAELNAKLTINSSVGNGTEICLKLPI